MNINIIKKIIFTILVTNFLFSGTLYLSRSLDSISNITVKYPNFKQPGDGNDFNTTQKDEDQILIMAYDGDDGNIDIIQQSGSCPQGVTTCSGKVDLDITSDDATITINQKDSSD